MASGVAVGVASGLAVGVASGVAAGVASGVAVGVLASGVVVGVAWRFRSCSRGRRGQRRCSRCRGGLRRCGLLGDGELAGCPAGGRGRLLLTSDDEKAGHG